MSPETKGAPGLCKAFDAFINRTDQLTSWLVVVLIVVILVQGVLRYAVGRGLVVLEEDQWQLHSYLESLSNENVSN